MQSMTQALIKGKGKLYMLVKGTCLLSTTVYEASNASMGHMGLGVGWPGNILPGLAVAAHKIP